MAVGRYRLARIGTETVAVVDKVESLRSMVFSVRVESCRVMLPVPTDGVPDVAVCRTWLESARDLRNEVMFTLGIVEML